MRAVAPVAPVAPVAAVCRGHHRVPGIGFPIWARTFVCVVAGTERDLTLGRVQHVRWVTSETREVRKVLLHSVAVFRIAVHRRNAVPCPIVTERRVPRCPYIPNQSLSQVQPLRFVPGFVLA